MFRTLEVVTMPDVREAPSETWRLGLYLLVAISIVGVIPSQRVLVRSVAMSLLFLLGLICIFLLMIPKAVL